MCAVVVVVVVMDQAGGEEEEEEGESYRVKDLVVDRRVEDSDLMRKRS